MTEKYLDRDKIWEKENQTELNISLLLNETMISKQIQVKYKRKGDKSQSEKKNELTQTLNTQANERETEQK